MRLSRSCSLKLDMKLDTALLWRWSISPLDQLRESVASLRAWAVLISGGCLAGSTTAVEGDGEDCMTDRRKFVKGTLALPLLTAGAMSLHAQEPWPARTITLVVPFPPGGVADFAARPLAAFLSETFGKNVVVENKGGAGGGIGHAYVARAEPDGYTIMTALPSLAVIPEANRLVGKPVTYEIDQFVPLARMFADPPLLTVKTSSPWKTLGDFVTAVRNNPGQIAYGTSGYLGTVHLAMEMFLNAAGLKMVHVPYQGGGPAFTALLSHQVPVVPTLESIGKGHFDAGNLRVLAQWGTERLPAFKDAPTFQEAGYPDV